MNFIPQILFFLGAIGVFNSVIMSLYFIFVTKSKRFSNRFLGLFLFFLSERVLKSLVYFFSSSIPNEYSRFGPITFLFIGPFLYFYIRSITRPSDHKNSYWKFHLILWTLIALSIHFIFPFKEDPIFWKRYILLAINFQWLFYIIISFYISKNLLKEVFRNKLSSLELQYWLLFILVCTSILWLLFYFFILIRNN